METTGGSRQKGKRFMDDGLRRAERGFTLLEIVVAMAISIIVAAGIYSLYISQVRTRAVQDSIQGMQQNLRAAFYIMARDIRMAGYDGNLAGSGSGAGIQVATATALDFTYVADTDGFNNDGDDEIDESDELTTIQYALYDSDGDGNNDDIGRTADGVVSPAAENIENIEFLYVLVDGTEVYVPADPADIRSVRLTILARSTRPDREFMDIRTYARPAPTGVDPAPVWGPFNDGFHRSILTGTFFLRNMR